MNKSFITYIYYKQHNNLNPYRLATSKCQILMEIDFLIGWHPLSIIDMSLLCKSLNCARGLSECLQLPNLVEQMHVIPCLLKWDFHRLSLGIKLIFYSHRNWKKKYNSKELFGNIRRRQGVCPRVHRRKHRTLTVTSIPP